MDIERLIGEQERIELIPPQLQDIQPDKLWADYDAPADLFVVYFASQPLPSVAHYLTENLMALTPLDTNQIIGFQVEGWEAEYVPTQPKLAAWWPVFKHSFQEDGGGNPSLILMAVVWLFDSLFSSDLEHHLALILA